MKVNEWAGLGNHNSALFWEYDTRTGRRAELDPKPRVGISGYSTFASNPILYPDVLGDLIIIKGTQEYQNKTLSKLQLLTNDQLKLGKDGVVEIVSHGTANKGKDYSFGTSLVSELVGNKSPNTINQTNGPNKTATYTTYVKDKKVKGTRSDVDFNPDNTKTGKDVEGNTQKPAEITLGHELIHVKHNNDQTDVSKTPALPDYDNPGHTLEQEEGARLEENKLRKEHDLPNRIKEK